MILNTPLLINPDGKVNPGGNVPAAKTNLTSFGGDTGIETENGIPEHPQRTNDDRQNICIGACVHVYALASASAFT